MSSHLVRLLPSLAVWFMLLSVARSTPTLEPDALNQLQPTFTFPPFPQPSLVPWPANVRLSPNYTVLSPLSTVVLVNGSGAGAATTSSPSLSSLATLFAEEISLATGGQVNASVAHGKLPPTAATVLSLSIDPSLGEAKSRLSVTAAGVTIVGGTYAAVVTATATALQLMEYGHDCHEELGLLCGTSVWRMPHLEVDDEPVLEYRGLMIDLARNFHPVQYLKRYVIMCRLYKLNSFHMHLSDNEAFSFPSTAFPKLATKGNSYTLAELQSLQAFARVRGVTIVGEIDVPGHSTALVNAYPEVFGFASKPALGIINFVNETTIAAIETLLDEIAAVFPSPIAHTGGDEVSLSELDDLPEIQAAISAHHVNNSYDLYRMFIARMHSYASSRNRTLHVWEGFAPQGGQTGRSAHPASSVVIPTDVVVEPFDCYYYNPPQLALDGYKIVNAAWTPLYIAGGKGRDVELIYQWHPWLFGEFPGQLSWWQVPPARYSSVIGAEMAVWQTSPQDTVRLLEPRVPTMMERAWAPQGGRGFAGFLVRMNHTRDLLHCLYGAIPPPPPTPTPGGTYQP